MPSTVGITAIWTCTLCRCTAKTHQITAAGAAMVIDPPPGWKVIDRQAYCGAFHGSPQEVENLESLAHYMGRRGA